MLLSEHIMKNYARAFRKMASGGQNTEEEDIDNFNSQTYVGREEGSKIHRQSTIPSQYSEKLMHDKTSISMKYRKGASQVTDPIPSILLKKYLFVGILILYRYLIYIRQNIRPKMSQAAADVLKEFYLMLRKEYSNDTCTPINTRQMESLIRLAQVCVLTVVE